MNGNFKIKSEWVFTSVKKGTALNVEVLYICDPNLNTECKKTNCGECTHTRNIKFAKRFDVNE